MRIKLLALGAAPVLLGGVIATAVLINKPEPQVQAVSTVQDTHQPVSEVTEPVITETQANESIPSPAPAPTPVHAPAPAPVPAPTPTPKPMYGEDPARPGLYVVFDMDAAMNEAGIAESDKQYVLQIANGGRIYNGPHYSHSLFGANPKSRMAFAGEDYETNPVTQLKYGDTYAKARYGSWENAAKVYAESKFF